MSPFFLALARLCAPPPMFRGSALCGALRHVASKNCGKRAPVRVADETRRWTPASARRALSTPGPAQVGFIGLGNMGSAMAANIVKARGSALVHDVSNLHPCALLCASHFSSCRRGHKIACIAWQARIRAC